MHYCEGRGRELKRSNARPHAVVCEYVDRVEAQPVLGLVAWDDAADAMRGGGVSSVYTYVCVCLLSLSLSLCVCFLWCVCVCVRVCACVSSSRTRHLCERD